MAIRIVITAPEFISAFMRKVFYKYLYIHVAKRTEDIVLPFMNYGYEPLSGEPSLVPLNLSADETEFKYSAQLYQHVIGDVDLTGKSVLEVGSGRGGGTHFLYKHYKPQKIVGVDLCSITVKSSNEKYGGAEIEFKTGDAQNLPFESNSFDVVVNVESSHCYPSTSRFFSEVRRVLKPGGFFLYTDFRSVNRSEQWQNEIDDCGMKLLRKKDITENVLKSLELDAARKEQLLCKTKVRNEKERQKLIRFAAMPGSIEYDRFKTRFYDYYSFVFEG